MGTRSFQHGITGSHKHLRDQYKTNYDLNKHKITEEFAQIDERFLGFHFIKSKRLTFSVDSF